ncbi:MAG: hypothetical protein MN733_31785 [Nitrososphaera sp.]|nr:hypothetical protein [Nitrososphaera sp.]
MQILFRSIAIADPLVKAYSAPSTSSYFPVPLETPINYGRDSTPEERDRTLNLNHLLSVKEHRLQMKAISQAFDVKLRPGCLVIRKTQITNLADEPATDPNNDDRVGVIVGYAARPSLLTNADDATKTLAYNALLVKWGGDKHRYRQPYAYSDKEIILYVCPNQPPPGNPTVGDSIQTG